MATRKLAIISMESLLLAPGMPGLTFEVEPSQNSKQEVSELAVTVKAGATSGDQKATLTRSTKSALLRFESRLPPPPIKWKITLTADFDKGVLKAAVNGDGGETDYAFDGVIAAWS